MRWHQLDSLSLGSESATLPAKNTCGFVIDSEHFGAAHKIPQRFFALFRLARIENPLVQFGERDHGQTNPLPFQFLNAFDNSGMTVEIMYHPISIDQVEHRLDTRGRARRYQTIGVDVRQELIGINYALPGSCRPAQGITIGSRRFGLVYTNEHFLAFTQRDSVQYFEAVAPHASPDNGLFT